MINFKIIFTILILFFSTQGNIYGDVPYFLDFKYILNKSEAGSKAQDFLKKKLDKGIKSLQEKEKKIQAEEKKIIQQKKSFLLRSIRKNYRFEKKVSDLQKREILC